jgi:hypothetical protein
MESLALARFRFPSSGADLSSGSGYPKLPDVLIWRARRRRLLFVMIALEELSNVNDCTTLLNIHIHLTHYTY